MPPFRGKLVYFVTMKHSASARLTTEILKLLIFQIFFFDFNTSLVAKTFYAENLFQKPVIKQKKPTQIKPQTKRPIVKQVPKAKRQIKPKPVSVKAKIKSVRAPKVKSPKPRVRVK